MSSGLVAPAHVFAAPSQQWLNYHLDRGHAANDQNEAPATKATKAWTYSTGSEDTYAEPLVSGNTVYEATEANNLYAIDATTGAKQWSVSLGTPVNASSLPCGNISPTVGVTSTPVIDPSADGGQGAIFVSAFNGDTNGNPVAHNLYKVNLANHAVDSGWPVSDDASGSDPSVENQRGALALANGNVYVPFGGNSGDCGNYHGFVTARKELDGSAVGYRFETVPNDVGAGAWAAGGLAVDSSGNVYVTTGNTTNGTTTFAYQESIVKLDPTNPSHVVDYWAPTNWFSLDQSDTDVGGMAQIVLGNTGLLFVAGKNGVGYLVRQSAMGHVGAPVYAHQVSSQTSDACFGSSAFDGLHIFVPCNDGLYALTLNTSGSPSFSIAWSTSWHSWPPIVAGGAVWAMDDGNTLHALNPSNGNEIASLTLDQSSAHFGTGAAANGRVFVPLADGVEAVDFAQTGVAEQSLGGTLWSGADASSSGPNDLEAFGRGMDLAMWNRTWNGTNWGQWMSLGGQFTSNPGAVSCGAQTFAFGRGNDNALWYKTATGGVWSASWQSLGGILVGGPDAAAADCGHIYVFVRGRDNAAWYRMWNGSLWTAWQSLGGALTADPGVVVRSGSSSVDVFVRSTDNGLWWIELNGSPSYWSSLGGILNSGPDAASWGSNRMGAFVVGQDEALWMITWNGTTWSQWQSIGGSWTADPGAVSHASTSVDIFARTTDDSLSDVTVPVS